MSAGKNDERTPTPAVARAFDTVRAVARYCMVNVRTVYTETMLTGLQPVLKPLQSSRTSCPPTSVDPLTFYLIIISTESKLLGRLATGRSGEVFDNATKVRRGLFVGLASFPLSSAGYSWPSMSRRSDGMRVGRNLRVQGGSGWFHRAGCTAVGRGRLRKFLTTLNTRGLSLDRRRFCSLLV
jgi:hypothetical protein